MLAVTLIGGTLPAFGQSSLYDTTRVLEYTGVECAGTPSCKTVKAGRHKIDAGQSEILTFHCPTRTPYFVGWDTEQNEHIQATALRRLPPNTSSGGPGTQPDTQLVILAENVGPATGHLTMYLGCSVTATLPSGMMRQRSSVPSNNATFLGGN